MFFLLRDFFRDEDFSKYNITEEEFGMVANGIDSKMFIVRIKEDIESEIDKAFIDYYANYNKCIAIIKSKEQLSSEENDLIVDEITDRLESGAFIKCVSKIDENIDVKLKIIMIVSK